MITSELQDIHYSWITIRNVHAFCMTVRLILLTVPQGRNIIRSKYAIFLPPSLGLPRKILRQLLRINKCQPSRKFPRFSANISLAIAISYFKKRGKYTSGLNLTYKLYQACDYGKFMQISLIDFNFAALLWTVASGNNINIAYPRLFLYQRTNGWTF